MTLTTPRRKAAALVASGDKTLEQIAAEIGISPKTMDLWVKRPEFIDCVEQIAAKAAASLERKGITEKANRLRDYDELRNRSFQVIRERGETPLMAMVPGGESGLLVRGEFGYAFDGVLVDAVLKADKQAAIEMGQWVEKRQSEDKLTVTGGDELAALERSITRLAAAGLAKRGAGEPDAGATQPAALQLAVLGEGEPATA